MWLGDDNKYDRCDSPCPVLYSKSRHLYIDLVSERDILSKHETHFSLPKLAQYALLNLSAATWVFPGCVHANQPQSDNMVFYRHYEAVPKIEFVAGGWPRRPDVECHIGKRLSDERREESKGFCRPAQEEGAFIVGPRAEPYSSCLP